MDPNYARETARSLREAGLSYAEVGARLGIPKSTAYHLVTSEASPRTKQREHLERARVVARQSLARRRETERCRIAALATQESAAVDFSSPTVSKSLIAMLYWAEGAKHKGVSGLKFVNTDPSLLLFYITLLRRTYALDERRFRVRLHLHSYHDANGAVRFWSELLGVPPSQFGKLYVKKRSKQRKFRPNFMGICFVNYLDSSIRKELLALANALRVRACENAPPSFNG